MNLEEKKKLCFTVFAAWVNAENRKTDLSKHDEDIYEMFVPSILLDKFKAFNVNVVLPDMLLVIIDICTEGNPGLSQVILKDLLSNIANKFNERKIPSGYVIKTNDFSKCFPTEFPIISISNIYDKYIKMWDGQKNNGGNLCDTVKWWKEVVE